MAPNGPPADASDPSPPASPSPPLTPAKSAASSPLQVILLVAGAFILMELFQRFIAIQIWIEVVEEYGSGTLSWGNTAFAVLAVTALLPAGYLSDHIGPKRVFLGGISFKMAGVSLQVLAPTGAIVVLGKILHGTGDAMVVVAGFTLVLSATHARRRSAALGGYFVMGGLVAVGGGLVDVFVEMLDLEWGLAWYLLIGLMTLLVIRTKLVEYPQDRQNNSLDLLGMLLMIGGAGSFFFAVAQNTSWGWIDGRTIALLVVSPLLILLFIYHASTRRASALNLDSVLDRNVVLANLAIIFFAGGSFFVSFGLGQATASMVESLSARVYVVGLIFGVVAGVLLVPYWIGCLADKYGHRELIVFAGVCNLTASIWLSLIDIEQSADSRFYGVKELDTAVWLGTTALLAIGNAVGLVSIMGAAVRSFNLKNVGMGAALHVVSLTFGVTLFALALSVLLEKADFELGDYWNWQFEIAAVASAIGMVLALGIDTRPGQDDPASESTEVALPESG